MQYTGIETEITAVVTITSKKNSFDWAVKIKKADLCLRVMICNPSAA